MSFTVPDSELTIRATRAGGPGGQHVNKASTRVEVVWDVASSPSLTDEQRTLLLQRLASKLDRGGRLRVVADEHRSQLRNREAALERLEALVAAALRPRTRRIPTKPTAASVRRRLDAKRRRAARKGDRKPPEAE
jgi:ribosome-associated protein